MKKSRKSKIKRQAVDFQTAEKQFLTQLENFRNEARSVANYGYADMTIDHAASKSKLLLSRLNNTPTFWRATKSALQVATYITLGRIFDNNGRYNIKLLLD